VSQGHATLGLTESQKEQEMPHSTLDKVLADAQALSPEEQRRLRAKLDEWLTPGPTCRTEAEFEQQLVAQGILSAVVGDDSGGPPVVAVYFLDGSDKQVMLCPGFLVEIMLICKRLRSTSASASITSVALPCVLLRRSKKS